MTDGTHYESERALDISAVTLQVGWNLAEPDPGIFDRAYFARVRSEVARARAAGMGVIIDPGIQYAPRWVLSLDAGSRFVDQYGDVFAGSPGSGDAVPNAVTDSAVRHALSAYLMELGRALSGETLLAVRVGGGPMGELRYPPATYADHSNCFWAYDRATQLTSPVPGWRPGTGTTSEAQRFLSAYDANLAEYGRWLSQEVMRALPGVSQLLMLPGWGQRPREAERGVASLLTANLPELNLGENWSAQISAMPYPSETVAYTTWLDAPSYGDTAENEDPVRYLAGLARTAGMPLGGENTGGGTAAQLRLVLERAKRFGLVIVNWMAEAQIYDSTAFRSSFPQASEITPAQFAAALDAMHQG